jgi:gluconokinase
MIAVVMGVSASGKTTIGELAATKLGCEFQEGDDLHPPSNVAKMRAGEPLTDADRAPWLARIAAEIDDWRARGVCGVVACSALKRSYRDVLIGKRRDVTLVYLKGSYELIHRRMAARKGHFMPISLLRSQFDTLEEPTPDEHPLVINIGGRAKTVADELARRLKAKMIA